MIPSLSSSIGVKTARILAKKQRKREELYHYVEQNLLSRRRQGLSINKFKLVKLVMILTTPKSMDRWIEYVLKSDVEELDLDFFILDRKIIPCFRVFYLQNQ
jgi:hypothetical protein